MGKLNQTYLSAQMPETWWQWLILLLGIVLAFFVIKISVTLNINELLAARLKRRNIQLQNACPHLTIMPNENRQLLVTDHFYSPPGSIMYICNRCQLQTYDPDAQFPGRAEYFTSNIDKYIEAQRRFEQLLKKQKYT